MPTARWHQGADFAHEVPPKQRFTHPGRFSPTSVLTSAVPRLSSRELGAARRS